MSDEKTMGRSSRSMKPEYGIILARWFAGLWKRRSTPCWMLRQTSCAVPGVTSVARLGRIPGLAVTIGSFRPAPSRSCRAERARDADLLRLPRHSLAEDLEPTIHWSGS